MLELVVYACLVASPAKCKDTVIAYAPEGMTLHACAAGAMTELAKWAGDNPNWTIQSWHCRVQGKKETNA